MQRPLLSLSPARYDPLSLSLCLFVRDTLQLNVRGRPNDVLVYAAALCAIYFGLTSRLLSFYVLFLSIDARPHRDAEPKTTSPSELAYVNRPLSSSSLL